MYLNIDITIIIKIPKEISKMTLERTQYNQKLKERTDREQFRPNPFRSNRLFTETTQQDPKPLIKYQPKIFSRSQEPERKTGIKINLKAKNSLVGKVLISANDCPIYKPRRVAKLPSNKGLPSKEYTRMLEKQVMIPHQVDNVDNLDLTLMRNNTFDRLFVSGEIQRCPRFRFADVPAAKESMSSIISYENGPKYKDVYYTRKPNLVDYKTIVNTIENKLKK